MTKFGQAEYAIYIMKQLSEKLRDQNIITEEQYRQLTAKNNNDCFNQFCTANAA
jgi:hypothetical protein